MPLGALVGVVAVIVVLIGGAVVWKMTSKPPEPDQVPVQVAIDQPSTPVTQKVELTPAKVVLKTNPDGAEVLEGGVMIGNTPLTLDWARGSTRELTFKLAGHKDLVKNLRSEADQSFDFQLEAASSPKPIPGKKTPPKKGPDIGAFD